jgi:hypothetical protein
MTTARTYSTLETETSEWLSKAGDPFFQEAFPLFVQLVETVIRKTMRTRKLQTSTTLEVVGGNVAVPLPDDYAGLRGQPYLTATDGNHPLSYHARGSLDDTAARTEQGVPSAYFVYGSDLIVYPVPNDDYVLFLPYYAKLVSLGVDSQTNWLIERHPDIYFAGVMTYANLFEQDFDQAAGWRMKFRTGIRNLIMRDKKDQFSEVELRQSTARLPFDVPLARYGRIH